MSMWRVDMPTRRVDMSSGRVDMSSGRIGMPTGSVDASPSGESPSGKIVGSLGPALAGGVGRVRA